MGIRLTEAVNLGQHFLPPSLAQSSIDEHEECWIQNFLLIWFLVTECTIVMGLGEKGVSGNQGAFHVRLTPKVRRSLSFRTLGTFRERELLRI